MLFVMVTTIGSKLRPPHLYMTEWREHFGLSVQTVAGRVETSRETVWRWENEQHRLNPGKIGAFAVALGIEPAQLFRPPEKSRLSAPDAPVTKAELAAELAEIKRLIRK
jgi:transcriptional regulator with XRE-family HTH domain